MMITILVVCVAALTAALVYSYVHTGGGHRYDLSFYEKDRGHQPGAAFKRRYQSPGHFLYRLREVAQYAWPLARVYALRTLSPGFREKIMITTAMANSCRH